MLTSNRPGWRPILLASRKTDVARPVMRDVDECETPWLAWPLQARLLLGFGSPFALRLNSRR